MIFNVTGGGGTPLNFKVVGGTTQPTSPKENTIWVNTNTAISGYTISAIATPGWAMPSGWVYINAGIGTASGSPEFNALKKNEILIKPASVKQYVGGQWEVKEAKIYQGGQWVDWIEELYLYNSGTFNEEISHAEKKQPSNAVIEYQNDRIRVKTVAGKTSETYVVFGPVDVTWMSELEALWIVGSPGEGNSKQIFVLFVAETVDSSYNDAEAITEDAVGYGTNITAGTGTERTVVLDVSNLSGEKYVYVGTNTEGVAWSGGRYHDIGMVKGNV